MINRIKMFILSMAGVIMFALMSVMPATVMAADCTGGAAVTPSSTNTCLCQGSNITFDATGSQDCSKGQAGVGSLVRTIINVLSLVVGAVAVIMIIVAGFRYVTSGGKEEGVKNAKNTILYAIIGLVVVALAQVIVHYVLNNTSTVAANG
jgi:hypothetical protein